MNNKNINPILYFLLVYVFGIFGVHKFVDGNKKQGIIYLCTLGLCGFGWIYDFIKAGIAAIKYLLNKNTPIAPSNDNDFDSNGIMFTKLRGVTKDCINIIGLNRQNALQNITEHTPIHLEPSGNIFLAITDDSGIDIGEITYERSTKLNEYPLSQLNIHIKNITGGTDNKYYGCNVIITNK